MAGMVKMGRLGPKAVQALQDPRALPALRELTASLEARAYPARQARPVLKDPPDPQALRASKANQAQAARRGLSVPRGPKGTRVRRPRPAPRGIPERQ